VKQPDHRCVWSLQALGLAGSVGCDTRVRAASYMMSEPEGVDDAKHCLKHGILEDDLEEMKVSYKSL
jgi:hypothetical protein